VNVDHAEPRNGQQLLRNDAPVCGDDTEVGSPAPERLRDLRRLQTVWLIHGNPAFEGKRFHGRMGDLLSSAARAVWLGDHASDRMRRVDEAPKGGHRELRCPEEHHYHLPVRESFLILRTMRSF